MLLFLMAGVALVALVSAKLETKRLAEKFHNIKVLPKGISLLLLASQASELVRAVESANFVHVVTALFLLVVLMATKSGTEDPFH